MKFAVVLAALAAVVLSAASASAQTVLPGCLQPDRGIVRLVAGARACQPAEVAVALTVRQAPAALQLQSTPTAGHILPLPAAGPDAAMVAFFTAERASAPVGVSTNRAAVGLAVPMSPTLARIGAGLAPIR